MIPFEFVIWDAQETADYLKESKEYFLRTTRYSEGFPAPISEDNKRPKWSALEVKNWVFRSRMHIFTQNLPNAELSR